MRLGDMLKKSEALRQGIGVVEVIQT